MADKTTSPDKDAKEKVPLAQAFFDNIFILLVLGIAVPTIFYIIWGLLDIANLPVAK